MTMEKSWVVMKDRIDKEHEEQEKLQPFLQVTGGIPERAVCDLETGINPCSRVTNADDRVDRQGQTVTRSRRQRREEDWRSLYVVEITLFSIHSCTLSQCSDLRIWSGLEDLGAATTARARAFWICCATVQGDLTTLVCLRKTITVCRITFE